MLAGGLLLFNFLAMSRMGVESHFLSLLIDIKIDAALADLMKYTCFTAFVGGSTYFLSSQFSIFRPFINLKSLTLSVIKTNSFSEAVIPIIKSNSSCIGVPFFRNLTFSFAYLFTMP